MTLIGIIAKTLTTLEKSVVKSPDVNSIKIVPSI